MTLPDPTHPPPAVLPAGVVGWPPDHVGDYCIGRKLGEGGMGAVFEAEDQHLKRRAAIKVMKPTLLADADARARFVREARLMAAVRHDNVIQVFAVGGQDTLPYIAMELLAGDTLAARLEKHGAIPFPPAAVIARQTAEALAAAHAVGLVHRDVKPSNIWLEANDDRTFKRVKLLDFGLTRPVDAGDDALTKTGDIVGTPAYMSPEQSHGKPVDARTDLFSLGVVMYEMLTGTRPFTGASQLEILFKISTASQATASSLNPAVPAAMSDLIDRLLAKDPAGRPPSAKAVADELRKVAKSVRGGTPVTYVPLIVASTPPQPVTPEERPPDPPKPTRRKLLLAVGAVVPVTVAGGYLALGGRGTKATPRAGGLLTLDPKASARDWAEEVQRRVGRVMLGTTMIGGAFVVTPTGRMLAGLIPETGPRGVPPVVDLHGIRLTVTNVYRIPGRPCTVLTVEPPPADWLALSLDRAELLKGHESTTGWRTGLVTKVGESRSPRPGEPEVEVFQNSPAAGESFDGGPLVARDGTVIGLLATVRDAEGKSVVNSFGYALTLPQLRAEIDARCPEAVWRSVVGGSAMG